MAHAFLSYVREDAATVDQLAQTLSSNGINIWMDRQSIRPGERWDMAILEAIRDGDFFVACFSENSVAKSRSGMNRELSLAVEELTLRPLNRAWFIPVLLSPCEIPDLSIGGNATLRSIQFVSLYSHWQRGIAQILDILAPNRPRLRDQSRNEKILEAIKLLGSSRQPQRGVPLVSAFGRDAVPFLIEAIKAQDPKNFHKDLLVECLGEIGSGAIDAVPAILEYSQVSGQYQYAIAKALGRIGGPLAVRALKDAYVLYKDTAIGDQILLGIGDTGEASCLPMLIGELRGWRGDGRPTLEIFGGDGDKGDIVSSLFPYRITHALKLFGIGAIPALNNMLAVDEQILKIRAACALASITEDHSPDYEPMMIAAIKEGGAVAKEALCALRCFKQISTRECLSQLIDVSRGADAGLGLLAVRVLIGNVTESPEISEVVEGWRKKNSSWPTYRYDPLPKDASQKSIWYEIYYWSNGS